MGNVNGFFVSEIKGMGNLNLLEEACLQEIAKLSYDKEENEVSDDKTKRSKKLGSDISYSVTVIARHVGRDRSSVSKSLTKLKHLDFFQDVVSKSSFLNSHTQHSLELNMSKIYRLYVCKKTCEALRINIRYAEGNTRSERESSRIRNEKMEKFIQSASETYPGDYSYPLITTLSFPFPEVDIIHNWEEIVDQGNKALRIFWKKYGDRVRNNQSVTGIQIENLVDNDKIHSQELSSVGTRGFNSLQQVSIDDSDGVEDFETINIMDKQYVSISELMQLYSLSKATVLKWIKDETSGIKYFYDEQTLRVNLGDFQSYIDEKVKTSMKKHTMKKHTKKKHTMKKKLSSFSNK